MHDFTHGDKTVSFTVLSGEVVGSEKVSETRVTSTGGVHVNGNDRDVTPVRISSVSIINHEFWVKTPDGVEHDVKLRGVDIPLRTGQEISLISALNKDGSPLHTILQNHTASKRWVLRDANVLNTELELSPFNWKTVLIVLGLCVAGLATAGLGFLAATGYFCYAWYQGSQRKKLLISDLNAYIEKLGNQVASRGQAPSPVQVESPAQAEISFQTESPAPAQPPAETESPALNSESVRRALSRNL
ncbi:MULTISPECIES: hypothetical protein [Gammaproteobacteria]|jgi:hypothetical protein|uniref:Uncharacterized protein n=1 Tax=Pseudomonas lini TaxID=163011 RepID=A0A423IXD5_9PSED|nr:MULTISPECIES: hypothetical protein [Gammaproteobacteria]MBK5301649.1 hypothetical protein [Bacillus sp. TH86]MBK5321418.1 hypothetical protein [Bacillus sp. TH59]MBK5336368.1 hypothetical protein [Bacillus sp. TH57]MBK5310438.1 hypothetical protein [Pseudomonas sp. TH71]MBK5315916.1 hypothetical protein [Erwinia sp. TH79]